MKFSSLIKVPSALIPLLMSAAALGLIVLALTTGIGVSHDGDESSSARLFQLLIVAQLPVVGYFAVKWLPRVGRPAVLVLSLQIAAVALAVGTIAWLERQSGPLSITNSTYMSFAGWECEGRPCGPCADARSGCRRSSYRS
jgi:hypothetical protein